MARRRDYAAEYARRQERARSLGFGSYYRRRVAGTTGEVRARAAGHRSTADFRRAVSSSRTVIVDIQPGTREAGRYTSLRVVVTDSKLRQRVYDVPVSSAADVRRIADWIERVSPDVIVIGVHYVRQAQQEEAAS